MKAKQSSQAQSNVPANPIVKPKKVIEEIPVPTQTEDVVEDDELLDENEEELEKEEQILAEQEKVAPKPSKEELEQAKKQIAMEIEMLQNDGRYRAEMLHQMQEMNRALVVIAGVLVDLSGK